MTALADLRDRIEVLLMDVANDIYDTDTIDEGLRQAMDEYNLVSPLGMETVITLPGDGHEIALNGISGLIEVKSVWWPYDSDASQETWPPNKVKGFTLWWDDALPVLFLDIVDGSQPQQDDELRLWYVKSHTVQDLDSGDATTIPGVHLSAVISGAAGYAAMIRTIDLIEVAGTDMYSVGLLGVWGRKAVNDYKTFLERLRRQSVRSGVPWGQGWALDKWDQ